MDKCAALTTLLENQPDRLVFTRLANGMVSLAGMTETFTVDEVRMMLERRFGFDVVAATTAVDIIRRNGVLDHPLPASARLPLQKTANSAVVVDMYEVDYTPKTEGYSTQEIDKQLDTIKDFVTRYTFPDTTMSDIIVGPRKQVLKKNVQRVQRPDLPPSDGVGVPLKSMTWQKVVPVRRRLSTWRMAGAEILHGGRGDGMPDSKFDPRQLAMGIAIEREHTTNPAIAKEITKDHLTEIPEYNTYLQEMEDRARK
jgi:hypothetical protein